MLRLIEIVRAHSEAVLSGNMEKYQSHKGAPALRDHGPGPAVAALMKLSFEEEHKNTITELGGLQVGYVVGNFGPNRNNPSSVISCINGCIVA